MTRGARGRVYRRGMATAKQTSAKKKAAAGAKKKAAGPSTRPSASLRASGGAAGKKAAGKKAAGKQQAGPTARKSAVRVVEAPPPPLLLVERDRGRYLRDGERFGLTTIRLHDIGLLEVPSGTIVACDPFLVDGPPLARKVAPGSYLVTLAVAQFTSGDQRVAAATVRFRDDLPLRWEVATFDTTPRKRGADPGYPVDAGTGCFMDLGAQATIQAQPTVWPTPSYVALEKQLMTENYRHTWGWAIYQPDPASPANCVAFMSGYGDGVYASHWGLDQAGVPVCLTTDFELFPDEDWT